MSRQSRIAELRANIAAAEKAIADAAAAGSLDTVSASISTAGNSQSYTRTPAVWTDWIARWKKELSILCTGNAFFRARIVPDFGNP